MSDRIDTYEAVLSLSTPQGIRRDIYICNKKKIRLMRKGKMFKIRICQHGKHKKQFYYF